MAEVNFVTRHELELLPRSGISSTAAQNRKRFEADAWWAVTSQDAGLCHAAW